MMRYMAGLTGIVLLGLPLRHLIGNAYFKGMSAYRYEVYAIRDGVYYSHFRTGQKSIKAQFWKGIVWG